MEAQNLVVLCGAGLSIPEPSKFMSAVDVSRACYDKYAPTQVLPAAKRDDIDLLAGHFLANGQFESLFIRQLVPWDEFTGEPNSGHAAIADFLLAGAATAVLSANFDMMIEQWSSQHRVSLRGALDGQEAVAFANDSNPLIKFHGCMNRDREKTLWTRAQLGVDNIAKRIDSCKNWMEINLPDRDLLIVGFWTDWRYLNDILSNALEPLTTASVTVVDPSPTYDLEIKAPGLWNILSGSERFEHLQANGDEALDELRSEFSKTWTRKLYALGAPLYVAEKGDCPPELLEIPDLDLGALYELRRDTEGKPSGRAARSWKPGQSLAQTGYAHLLLAEKATSRIGAWYEIDGQTVRVVNGAGEGLATVQSRFVEPPAEPKADIVVCVGALRQGVPDRIIRKGTGDDVVRPAAGGGSRWLVFDEAFQDLGL